MRGSCPDPETGPPPAGLVGRLRAAGCVFAEEEAALLVAEAGDPDHLEDLLSRRTAGVPLEQVLGWAEFCGLRIQVAPGVFVPRRRTELLVREAAALLPDDAVVLDLGCGTGAVGAALLARADGKVTVHAVDVDPVAVGCAGRNLPAATVHQGDLYRPLPGRLRGRVDVIVANAPYVPTGEIGAMPSEARDHEHRVALDGGGDGLDVQRRIADEAPRWLGHGGHLLIETSDRQAHGTAALVAAAGLVPRVVTDEELGATVVVGAGSVGAANSSLHNGRMPGAG